MPRRTVKLVIWDDLPIPERIAPFPQMKHPLHEMLKELEVGECFVVPEELDSVTSNRLLAIKQRHSLATGKRFTFRTIYPKPWSKEKTIRSIWRTK